MVGGMVKYCHGDGPVALAPSEKEDISLLDSTQAGYPLFQLGNLVISVLVYLSWLQPDLSSLHLLIVTVVLTHIAVSPVLPQDSTSQSSMLNLSLVEPSAQL